jgi:Ser/Thr protein kinase RdoA (MazF antagonist)
MVLDEATIRSVLENFNIGRLQRVVRPLDSGFQSDNYHIQTDQGDFVVRVVHESAESVRFAMRVHEYLADHGVKTPRPARTSGGGLTYSSEGGLFVVQTFIPGADIYEPLEAVDPLLPFYGSQLGQLHRVLLAMTEDATSKEIGGGGGHISYVHDAGAKYMPDDDYVKAEYFRWKEEIERVPENELTSGIIHGDIGPKDFFFQDGELTGIMDFNAAHFSYLLLDIASMMMYCELIRPDRTEQYRTFMSSYLGTAPIQREELCWLHLILRTRWFVQIFYHQYRYEERITQGLDSEDADENLGGVTDGIHFLRVTNAYPLDHFYRLLD